MRIEVGRSYLARCRDPSQFERDERTNWQFQIVAELEHEGRRWFVAVKMCRGGAPTSLVFDENGKEVEPGAWGFYLTRRSKCLPWYPRHAEASLRGYTPSPPRTHTVPPLGRE